jgi:hypothetical protein
MEFPVLAFAVGVYLPLSTSAAIFAGAMIRAATNAWNEWRTSKSAEGEESSPGVLFSSGLIAGGAIAGIILAISQSGPFAQIAQMIDLSQALPAWLVKSNTTATVAFGAMAAVLWLVGTEKWLSKKKKIA